MEGRLHGQFLPQGHSSCCPNTGDGSLGSWAMPTQYLHASHSICQGVTGPGRATHCPSLRGRPGPSHSPHDPACPAGGRGRWRLNVPFPASSPEVLPGLSLEPDQSVQESTAAHCGCVSRVGLGLGPLPPLISVPCSALMSVPASPPSPAAHRLGAWLAQGSNAGGPGCWELAVPPPQWSCLGSRHSVSLRSPVSHLSEKCPLRICYFRLLTRPCPRWAEPGTTVH